MIRLVIILLFSCFGGTFTIHYLKNYLLKEKINFNLDSDGLIERFCITYIILQLTSYWYLIPAIIIIKAIFRLALLGFLPSIIQTNEPGASPQKVLLKAELAFDLFASPAFAIVVGVLFR